MKGLDEEAKKLFSTLSPEVQGHVSTLAQLLDGSFSLEALQAVVGLDGPKVKAVVRRLYDEAPLLIDSDSQRMRIEPLVLHHIRQIGHVTADDQVTRMESLSLSLCVYLCLSVCLSVCLSLSLSLSVSLCLSLSVSLSLSLSPLLS